MREHYSSVALDEKHVAMANVVRLIPRPSSENAGAKVGVEVGAKPKKTKGR